MSCFGWRIKRHPNVRKYFGIGSSSFEKRGWKLARAGLLSLSPLHKTEYCNISYIDYYTTEYFFYRLWQPQEESRGYSDPNLPTCRIDLVALNQPHKGTDHIQPKRQFYEIPELQLHRLCSSKPLNHTLLFPSMQRPNSKRMKCVLHSKAHHQARLYLSPISTEHKDKEEPKTNERV